MVPLIYNESTSSNSAKVKRLKTPWNIRRKIMENYRNSWKEHQCQGSLLLGGYTDSSEPWEKHRKTGMITGWCKYSQLYTDVQKWWCPWMSMKAGDSPMNHFRMWLCVAHSDSHHRFPWHQSCGGVHLDVPNLFLFPPGSVECVIRMGGCKSKHLEENMVTVFW